VVERKRHGRKLLIASIGVAAVSYVACGGSTTDTSGGGVGSSAGGSTAGTGGNGNTGGTIVTGNTGGTVNNTGGTVNNTGGQIAVGNLMAIPFDSGTDASAIKDAAIKDAVFVFPDNIIVANLIAPPPPDAKADTK